MSEKKGPAEYLRYTIHDKPPWALSIFLGFQHYLIMFGPTLVVPLLLTPKMCMDENDVSKSKIVSTIFFVSGLTTLLQSTFGVRLPIIQGGTYSFLVPAFAILNLPKFKCPSMSVVSNMTTISPAITTAITGDEGISSTEQWQIRMREVQGAIVVASLFQMVLGASGLIGILLRFIGPLSIAPTLTLIGISLFGAAGSSCEKQWGIAILTMALLTIFSQYMKNIKPRLPAIDRKKCCTTKKFPVFELFPVVLAILVAWLLSFILTITDVYPSDPSHASYYARTDSRINVLKEAPWFRVPYPGQWGLPTVSVAGVFGMLAGILAGIIESVGDYYACARISAAPVPPTHAINRGIFMEGFGCMIAGLWGTGNGTTSYSENIGAINITGVGSRRVVQMGGLIMMIFALFGKFGALFVTIPDPIVGGVLMVTFGMIAAVGISNLQFVNLNSSRNLFVFGFATFAGLAIPEWLKNHPEAIDTGNAVVDQILFVLGSTSMFVGGGLGFFLDNTIPGTAEDRGLTTWASNLTEDKPAANVSTDSCYDLPFCMNAMRKSTICQYIPILPTFKGKVCSSAVSSNAESSANNTASAIQQDDGVANAAYVV